MTIQPSGTAVDQNRPAPGARSGLSAGCPAPAGTVPQRAVLYVCSPVWERESAADLGTALAERKGYEIVETIRDLCDEEADPHLRPGWRLLVQLAKEQRFSVLITHLPHSVSRVPDQRHQALNGLAAHGVRFLYSWPGQEPRLRSGGEAQ